MVRGLDKKGVSEGGEMKNNMEITRVHNSTTASFKVC